MSQINKRAGPDLGCASLDVQLDIVGTYNHWLLLLSVVVAILASYVALDLASRVTASQSSKLERYWLTGGATSMGSGIWSMHFIDIRAFRLPIPMSYNVPITLLSLLIAISVSGFALYSVSRGTLSLRKLLSGGVLMGVGIASMHYTGMAAMHIDPPIRYEPFLFGLSILIAVAFSLAALWSAFELRFETILSAFWKKAGAALVMGGAIAGMHFTGMAAAVFAPNSIVTASPQDINDIWLCNIIAGFTMAFLGGTLLISAFDAYLADLSARHAESLRGLNITLEKQAAELSNANATLKQEVQVRLQAAEALRQAHAVIEARVAERTAELARTNQSLLEQIAERNAANGRILENEAQLRSLSRRLVEAQESERRQLSSELHDRIGQNCAALKLNLGIILSELPDAIKPKLGPRLYDSLQLINVTVGSIKEMMVELRPPMLDDHGLLAALRWMGSRFSRRTGIAVTVEGPEDFDRPAPAIEIGLCRIVQEALNNVAKHARAKHVTITVSAQEGKLGLVVSDDGTGFDPEVVLSRPDSGRWGLITMRERAQASGGTLTIDSAPGKGTRIIVSIAR